MFGKFSLLMLSAVSLSAVAAVGFTLYGEKTNLFDRDALEAHSDVATPVAIASVLAPDVDTICVLGPYASTESQLSSADPALTRQMHVHAVDEGSFRIAAFDSQTIILDEVNLPRWRGQIRIEADGFESAFCQRTEAVMVEIFSHDQYWSIQFVR